MIGYGTYEAVLDTLERAVSEAEYVAGPRFSAADVYVGSHILWGWNSSRWIAAGFRRLLVAAEEPPRVLRAKGIDDALIAELSRRCRERRGLEC